MKKTLLAMALSAAVAPAAFAQTNVTLYGIVDAGIEYARVSDGGGNAFRVQPGIQSGNRWGLRGTEDLGGGLKAIFTLEAGFNIDTGNFITNGAVAGSGEGTGAFGRRAFVGIESGFGQIYLGRDYSPGFWVALNSDRMQLGLYGNLAAMTNIQNLRTSNAITYVSPKFGGLSVRAQYGTGQELFNNTTAVAPAVGTSKDAGRFWGVAAEFAQGPLYLGAAYHNRQDTRTNAVDTESFTEWGVGASYNFGAFGINGGYFYTEPGNNTVLRGGYEDSQAYWIGAGVKIGAGDLLAQIGQTRFDSVLVNATTGARRDGKATTWGVAYTYPFSRRTNAYIAYGTVRNDGGAAVGLSTAGYTIGGTTARFGQDPMGVAIGVRHTF